ncbi:MAG: right-handed parallel beta-helix repeat-containing protein [Nannocystaceae bacterium]
MVGGCSGPGAETTAAETSSCVDGEEGCACLDGGVCESGLLCASQMCVPAGDTTSGSTTGESTTTTTSGTTTTTSAGTTGGECSPADGSVNPGCVAMNADAPYCSEAGECVDCSGLQACASPSAPVCDPQSGLCVECTASDGSACVGTTPVCDAATNTCIPCTSHEGCPASACNMLTGECFAEDGVLWVDAGDPSCSPSGGTQEAPLCSLEDAMTHVVMSGGGGPSVVRIHKGIYDGPVILPPGKLVAIVSADPGDPVTITGAADSLIEVPAGATLIADGLDIAGNGNGVGVAVTNGQLWLDRTTVHANKGLGLTTAMATNARVRSTLITGNSGGGVKVGGGVLRIENSYITKNGSAASFDGGITVTGGGEVEVLYSSVIGNLALLGDPSSLVCSDAGPVVVRNSVVVAEDNESIACDASIDYSAIDVFPGMGSTNMMLMSDALGAYFIELGGVYQAKPGTQLASVARWKSGDPIGDYDGDPRPEIEGPDYAGADVP